MELLDLTPMHTLLSWSVKDCILSNVTLRHCVHYCPAHTWIQWQGRHRVVYVLRAKFNVECGPSCRLTLILQSLVLVTLVDTLIAAPERDKVRNVQ